MAYAPKRKSKPLILGTDENYLDCEMDAKLREEHMHIIGAPRSGKSRFMLSLIQQDLRSKRGCCVIDPHGELIDHTRDWLAKNEHLTNRRKVHLLDFRDLEYSFGFNPLHVEGDEYINATVERAVDAIATASMGENTAGQPLLKNTLECICTALAYARLSLVEAMYLIDPWNPNERLAITNTIRNPVFAQKWEAYNQIAVKQPRLYVEEFRAAERRITSLIKSDLSYSIIGQTEGVLNLKQAMDDGDIILVDLSLIGGHVPPDSANILGRLLVSSFVGAALQRDPRVAKSKPYNLYIDEVHKYLSGDIPTILEECPKFGLHLTIAHQFLGQLGKADDKGMILDGVMAAAQNKICFRLANPEDAEMMQRRIFAGHYNLEKPKHSMDKPVVIGHEIIELESRSASQSEATTEGTASAEAVSYMEAQGYTESSATSHSETESDSLAHSRSKSHGTSDSHSSGQNSISSSGHGGSSGGGMTDSSNMGMGAGAGSSMNFGGGVTLDQDGNPVSTTDNMGGGESLSMMNTSGSGVSHSATHGASHSASHGSGASSGTAQGTNQSVTDAVTSSHSTSTGKTDTFGTAESYSTATGNTQSQGTSLGKMRGATASQGVGQTLKPILEERHTVLYSLEELKHQYTDAIMLLPKRTAFAVISGVGMVKIEALDTPDITVSKTRKARVIETLKNQSTIHKPMIEVKAEIKLRFQRFMEVAYPTVIDDPMLPPGQLNSINPAQEKQPMPNADPMNPDG